MLHADLAQMAALRRALHQIPEQGTRSSRPMIFGGLSPGCQVLR